ncbi:hypothetical protein PM082_007820 [Marasmius tenuissimus]|nr:hypothetical protein PM082_007820 [Marasmius tenuissimus]
MLQSLPNGARYNVEVFRKDGLENRPHTLIVDIEKPNYTVYAAFDYATYTVEEPDEDNHTNITLSRGSSKDVPTGAIAGGVIGGLVLTVGILPFFFVCRKRRNSRAQRGDGSDSISRIDPFMTHKRIDLHEAGSTPALHPTGIPVVPSEKAPSSLTRQQHQLLDQMREELSSLQESQNRQNYGNGGIHEPSSHSGTIQSGTVQGEIDELREQLRELQAQIVHPQYQLAVADTSPPMYTT